MSQLVYNGKNLRDYGIVIEQLPEIVHPERRGDRYKLAGRNGTQVHEDGTFENYDQPYDIWFRDFITKRDAYQLSQDLAEFLLSSSGYCRLEDTYEPDVFRMARFAGPMNVKTTLRRYGRTTLTFDCQPERFLKSGEKAVTLFENVDLAALDPSYAEATIVNPTSFSALPLLRITGSGTVDLSVESQKNHMHIRIALTRHTNTTASILIDCSSYKIQQEETSDSNYGSTISFFDNRDLAVLAPGSNQVLISAEDVRSGERGVIQKVDIIPRWWTI